MKSQTKSVIVLGKGYLAIKVADWFIKSPQYDLKMVIPVIPEPSWTKSLITWGKAKKVPILTSGHYQDLPKDLEIDLAFSVFYDKIIKQEFIDRCKQILNLHNSPLPRYRGVSPINWALKNKESMHGLTIHEITQGIDDGPIISQIQYSIYPDLDEVKDVYKRSLKYGWTLFKQTMPLIEKIKPRKQNHKKALYYSSKENNQLKERRYFTKKEST